MSLQMFKAALVIFLLPHDVGAKGGGCFIPGTLVTMTDGSRRPISDIKVGEHVRSWDQDAGNVTSALVLDVLRYTSSSLIELALNNGATIISTDDHPFWSHRAQALVSRNPNATSANYQLDTEWLTDEEQFEDENGAPLTGSVHPWQRATAIVAEGVVVQNQVEVMTLKLDTHHWFYTHGIRVHNKGAGGGGRGGGGGGRRRGTRGSGRQKRRVRVVGFLWMRGGSHGYRRRRGQTEDACHIVATDQPECQEEDKFDESACEQLSLEEYRNHQQCYDCQDQECVDDVDSECALFNGCNVTCDNEDLCQCDTKMQDNVQCNKEEEENWLMIVIIIICIASIPFMLWLGHKCRKDLRKHKAEQLEKMRLSHHACSGCNENPEASPPICGAWIASYLHGSSASQITYDLVFDVQGRITGSGTLPDGTAFGIKSGVYNLRTSTIRFLEVNRTTMEQREIVGKLTSPESIDGKYHKRTTVKGGGIIFKGLERDCICITESGSWKAEAASLGRNSGQMVQSPQTVGFTAKVAPVD
eukprot:gnl/MRDRNA2_/MRDRNA2_107587_c0_seq1.p1 gnl/MRDRNA2_/MRDRNA2_107587_c0~~gnl/MRDRNA2_/MRDRNA2_107587_c0_seq1.p1  ORF type:complete len:529 (-),score=86.22 gnl/MRDRNA2_/MRDRNA2_107587_c0_seq1:312-1898(-)